ncbi:MAG: hypothetical protein MUF54_05235 [Polyangiaceae bacterium]|nr:hypothetical protein [Polyangiaceae bacterium]
MIAHRAWMFLGLLALALGGCWMDIFHDTSWPTACDIVASSRDCVGGGGVDDGGDGVDDGGDGVDDGGDGGQ